MLLHEVCRECGLTKKAIEYYAEQGLIHPAVMENGYRDFSENDVERLSKIGVLRGLGLAVSDIRTVLDQHGGEAFRKMSNRKDLEISELYEKKILLDELALHNDWGSVRARLDALEMKQSILQRLLGRFPGYYGKYLSLHFSRFLGEIITTDEQQWAFETIISYLDGVYIEIPEELKEYLDEATQGFNEGMIPDISRSLAMAVRNTEQYMEENKDTLEEYMTFLNSDAYKQSQAYRLKEFLKELNRQSGYYDLFIPAMKKLSSSYRQYHDDLQKANELFIARFGDVQ